MGRKLKAERQAVPAEKHGLAKPALGPAGQRHRAAGASGLRGTAPKLQEKEEKNRFHRGGG